jgi:hypothetical protein
MAGLTVIQFLAVIVSNQARDGDCRSVEFQRHWGCCKGFLIVPFIEERFQLPTKFVFHDQLLSMKLSPQSCITRRTGSRVLPSSVREYSTLGGTCA